MDLLEQVADALAKDALEAERITGDEDIIKQVMKSVGSSSTTLEEAFMTAVRIRRAEMRGRALLEDLVRVAQKQNG